MKVTERFSIEGGDGAERARQVVAVLAAGLERALKRGRKFGERLEPPLDFPAELPVTMDYQSNGCAEEH